MISLRAVGHTGSGGLAARDYRSPYRGAGRSTCDDASWRACDYVAPAARQKFGFEPGAFVLRRQTSDEVLAPERPLVSYHIADGETLLLVPEMGSGV